MTTLEIVFLVLAIVFFVTTIVAFFAGVKYRKKVAEAEISSAEEKAELIVEEAKKTAKAAAREIRLEAKEENQKQKAEAEREIKERRAEVSRQENRIAQKEENLDKKIEALEKKEATLSQRTKELDTKHQEIDDLKQRAIAELEKVSGMTRDEAKDILLKDIEVESRKDAAKMVKEIEQDAKENADKEARNIIAMAIQKVASDSVSETTVSIINIPNDDMKGRIIGREGRNIRTLEAHTGVELIIDDTPEVIIISSFDPVRREVAKIAIEKLISDGRIHPARIEETCEKARKEVEAKIKQAGENACYEVGIHGLHPDLVKFLGRLSFRTSYGQNVLKHSIEVAELAGVIAGELGADITLAKRAGLLHDIGKAVDHEIEGSHITIGADIAKKYRENKEVLHCILAHHGDIEATTLEAVIVQAADAISAARPGARRENLETYIKRLQKLEEIANDFDGVEKSFAIQAGREIRVMIKPEVVTDEGMVIIARDIAKRIESELDYPGQIKVSLIRETRTYDYAK